jgi:ferrous iron transport protein A
MAPSDSAKISNYDEVIWTLVHRLQSFKAEVVGYLGDADLIERLKELGIHPGLQMTYLGRAPFSGPLLFRFGATVLALREEEVACLRLKRL